MFDLNEVVSPKSSKPHVLRVASSHVNELFDLKKYSQIFMNMDYELEPIGYSLNLSHVGEILLLWKLLQRWWVQKKVKMHSTCFEAKK